MQPVLVITTVPDKESADKIASNLIKKKIGACVNIIGPVLSVYEWQGAIEKEEEFKLFIKTFESLWKPVSETIREIHPYSVPEISMIEFKNISDSYLKWMNEVIH